MIRPSTVFWLLAVAVLSVSLFRVKYEVQALEDELVKVRRDTGIQQEALHVLRAEWSYLNQAERLQTLASKFLLLSPLTSTQIARIDQLPLRAAGAPPVSAPLGPLLQAPFANGALVAGASPAAGNAGRTLSAAAGSASSGSPAAQALRPNAAAQIAPAHLPPGRTVQAASPARSTPVAFHGPAARTQSARAPGTAP